MNILVILGHPDKNSLCKNLMGQYVKGAKSGGARVKELYLGELRFDPILHKGYKKIQELEPDLIEAQKAIKWADHLVFVYPNWWESFPALLKGFFDRAILPEFAFKYTGKYTWKKLLKGKSAHLIFTMGAPVFYYWWLGSPGYKVMKANLNFCGVRPIRSTAFGMIESASEERVQRIKEKVWKKGKKFY
ncbi:MAG: NAD(P)H-dependent oxidoreductase [Candidatus Woesearchaeota archaeon]